MVCSQSFEPGIKTNQKIKVYFSIDSYKEEELPIGFYTIWIDINYSDVYYPTIVSHAFMNITEEGVEIGIEWGDKTDYYSREVKFSSSFVIISLLVISFLIQLKRKSKNKKYFI
ncbi:MAG: hypothetical protein HGN29_05185 [Asgard group archaeon]|nr:hypothetical protein [Asgard group archaeon]